AVVATLLSGAPSGEPLGADNPGRDGGRALARVLADEGVDVVPVAGTAELLDRPVGPGTTVLLTGTAYLDAQAGADLVEHVSGADRLVVVVPDASSSPGPVLGLDVGTAASGGGPPREPDCDDPLTRPGDLLLRWDVELEATGPDRSTVTACYPPTRGHGAGGAREGAVLSFPAAADRPQTVLVGLGSALSNAHVTEGAHAALGLRLLGASPELLWVVPRPGDAAAETAPTTLWEALPRSTTPAVVVLGAAVLALALWRGRRLGPVVTEPLPAVVHASETTRNRGRLYRQARDRRHALAALRAGTRRRLAPRLGLPATTDAQTLARAAADATGLPADQVLRLLDGPVADDDATLVTTARELRSLEEGLHP
ncbi:MAG: DUF4350 domain-containing protein, partial [Acidobacteria bacterium]